MTSKLMWTPSQSTTVKLLGFYDKLESDVGINFNVYPGSVATDGSQNLGRYTVNHIDTPIRNEQYLIGLTVEQDFGWSRLVSLTGYQHLDNSFDFNVNGIAGRATPFKSSTNIRIDVGTQTRTQELQLLSPADSPIDWIAGLFYLDDRQSAAQITCVNLAAACNPPTAPSVLRAVQDTWSYATFGQMSFDVFAATGLILGLRYTDDKKELSGSKPGAAVPFPGAPFAGDPDGIPTSVGEFSIGANNSYNSGFYWDPDNRLKQKAYNSLNATLGWMINDQWRFELWGKNLLDEKIDATVQGASGGSDIQSPGEPCTYGARVNMRLRH